MPNTQEIKKRFSNKLKELFQLNCPDLDFGFYKIMHARAKEVGDFIDNTLPQIVSNAFEKETKAGTRSDADSVYYHLYQFFSRYYDDGDFVSMRYHTRETAEKSKPYAIPYGGEEVVLHWANSDQYYIKTAEAFKNFAFDPAATSETRNDTELHVPLKGKKFRVRFTIAETEEGEHGNIKESAGRKREFFLAKGSPLAWNATEEALEIRFQYRVPENGDTPDATAEKSLRERFGLGAKDSIKGTERSVLVATAGILDVLENAPEIPSEYLKLLKFSAPTDKISKRPLVAKYLTQYFGKNTTDYFIHKDLGAFLKRELDFYIKNEVMHLDEIGDETQDELAIATKLGTIRCIRKTGNKLIEFLAKLEDFQKKLWLKKKFVVGTNYCTTLDRVPEKLHNEILANEKQIAEWKRLGIWESANETLDGTNALMADTKFFDAKFKAKLLESIDDFDKNCDGTIIHAENFQALNLLQERYREQIKCIYIDPPYNTGNDGFIYRDNFQHSSWLSMMEDKLRQAKNTMPDDGVIFISIDDKEQANLKVLCDKIFGADNFESFIWKKKGGAGNTEKIIGCLTEHILCFFKKKNPGIFNYRNITRAYSFSDKLGGYNLEKIEKTNSGAYERQTMIFPITDPETGKNFFPSAGKRWTLGAQGVQSALEKGKLRFDYKKNTVYYVKRKDDYENSDNVFYNLLLECGSLSVAKNELDALFNERETFGTPKPSLLVNKILEIASRNNSSVLDFFAGSGTTAHAVINLNREDLKSTGTLGKRKYVLVEMGDHFETVLKPRIEKVVFSADWKGGKPANASSGISHCFKYFSLESYEDALNNLELPKESTISSETLKKYPELREDLLLHYLLDVDARESVLSVKDFANPFDYRIKMRVPESEATVERAVDLQETFNYLIGLRVAKYYSQKTYSAEFESVIEPDLPESASARIVIKGNPKIDESGKWTFQMIEGSVPANPLDPNNGQTKNVKIIWRTLTNNAAEDNAMLDRYLEKLAINPNERTGADCDIIYINGANNVGSELKEGEEPKMRLIEETFLRKMWEQ